MTSLSKKLLLCFFLCFGFIETAAQYRIDQWTADDGLPQNSVYGIVQTRDGYLWLATVVRSALKNDGTKRHNRKEKRQQRENTKRFP